MSEEKKGSSAAARAAAISAGAIGAQAVVGASLHDVALAAAGAVGGALFDGILTALQGLESRSAELGIILLREDVAKLFARVARLEASCTPDRVDPISTAQTVSDFARDIMASHTLIKREAVVNAAANQHDPRISGAATRAYWYDVLRTLPDLQVFVVRLVVRYGSIWFDGDKIVNIRDRQTLVDAPVELVDLQGEDYGSIHRMTMDLVNARILHESGSAGVSVRWEGRDYQVGRGFRFTPAGTILGRLIAD